MFKGLPVVYEFLYSTQEILFVLAELDITRQRDNGRHNIKYIKI